MTISRAVGQIYPMVNNYTPDQVRAAFRPAMTSEKNIKNNFSYFEQKKGDTITWTITGTEKIVRKYTFNLPVDICDFDQLTFYCDSCAIYHLDQILADKYYKWKKIKDNFYLSKYKYQTELYIDKTSPICITLTFMNSGINKDKYKSLYNQK